MLEEPGQDGAPARYGLRNALGDVILKPAYDQLSELPDGRWLSTKDGLVGLIDEAGDELLKPKYAALAPMADTGYGAYWLTTGADGLRGLVSPEGEELLAPKYAAISALAYNCFLLEQDGLFGVADGGGKVLLKPENECARIESGLIYYEKNGLYGLMRPDGVKFFAPTYPATEGNGYTVLDGGVVQVRVVGENGVRYGLYDASGKQTLKPEYHEIEPWDFGYLFSQQDEEGNTLYGAASFAGEKLCEAKYDNIDGSGEYEVFFIAQNGRVGLMNREGKVLRKPAYDDATLLSNGCWLLSDTNRDGETVYGLAAHDGELIYTVDMEYEPDLGVYYDAYGHAGQYDANDRLAFAPCYDDIEETERGRLLVSVNGRYGLASIKGKLLTDIVYDSITSARFGLWIVCRAGAYGLAADDGDLLAAPYYDSLAPFEGDMAVSHPLFVVTHRGKTGVLDGKGRLIVPARHDTINYLPRVDALIVYAGDKIGLYSASGDLLVEPVCDSYDESADDKAHGTALRMSAPGGLSITLDAFGQMDVCPQE